MGHGEVAFHARRVADVHMIASRNRMFGKRFLGQFSALHQNSQCREGECGKKKTGGGLGRPWKPPDRARAANWRLVALSRLDAGALRLSFAGLEPDQIRSGLAVLGRIVGEEISRVSQSVEPSPALV